jgi:hypothetical protein
MGELQYYKIKRVVFDLKRTERILEKSHIFLSIKRSNDNRKKVIHGDPKNTYRGLRSETIPRKRSTEKNSEIVIKFRTKTFDIFADPFNPTKWASDKWRRQKKYLLGQDPSTRNRVGNAMVANCKDYMDSQTKVHNSSKVIATKGFDKYSIDSGQLQLSIGFEHKRI